MWMDVLLLAYLIHSQQALCPERQKQLIWSLSLKCTVHNLLVEMKVSDACRKCEWKCNVLCSLTTVFNQTPCFRIHSDMFLHIQFVVVQQQCLEPQL